MKTIPYKKKKQTSNNNIYYDIAPYDLSWILKQSKILVDAADLFQQLGRSESFAFNKPHPILPKHNKGYQTGQKNSVKSFCEGLIENFDKDQYNISQSQAKGLVECFRVGHSIFEDFEEIVFEEVTQFPKIKLDEIIKDKEPTEHFKSLFEVDSITVTYKRKDLESDK